jgi:hypothetical protein
MFLRALVLYQGMNQIEDRILQPPTDTCWYRSWLRDDQSECYGRIFDFSDHIVLYFAQILPIALVECLDAMTPSTTMLALERRTRIGLVVGTLYLYAITLVSAFKTTAYFHTGPEVLAGYAVSLVIQLPLYVIQCRPSALRDWFFPSQKHGYHSLES